MAVRKLSDVFTPEEFNRAVLIENTTKLNVIESGLVVEDPILSDYAESASKTGTFPYDDDLGDDEPNIINDNPETESTPLKTSKKEATWVKNLWHQSWSAMTLARELHYSNQDPLDLIINRATNYWDKTMQRFVASMIVGAVADNIANDNNDMVLDLSTDQTPGASNYLSSNKLIESEATMGDSVGELSMIIINSKPYTRLRQLNLIDFVSPAAQDTLFGLYQNKVVIVNDTNALVGTNGSNATYDTILCGQNIFGMGVGMPEVPSELEREASKGNGGGQDILHFRNTNILHPYGFSFEGTPAGTTPTRAEYEEATSWDRIFPRQRIPLVVVRSNNAFVE